MAWPFNYYKPLRPEDRYIWFKLYETDKAILVYIGRKLWIPKSRIYGIRLRNNVFEVYVKENSGGHNI